MCLGIPMKILELKDDWGLVEMNCVKTQINTSAIENAAIGDWVIVHAGFAIEKLEEDEAQSTFDLLREAKLI